jgi:hypothetical protein
MTFLLDAQNIPFVIDITELLHIVKAGAVSAPTIAR